MLGTHWAVEWEEATRHLYQLARQEALTLGHDFVGSGHLLVAAATLASGERHGFPTLARDSVVTATLEVIRPHRPDILVLNPGAQTPRFKLATERAMQRAFDEGRAVAIRDVWHGLLADPDSGCAKVLQYLGLDVESLRKALT
ncbi:MAG: hypothetical protein L0Z62_02900 [Gemmataceae bacterium]|nr:hypothetical protein [Gemmataceae bacterium]